MAFPIQKCVKKKRVLVPPPNFATNAYNSLPTIYKRRPTADGLPPGPLWGRLGSFRGPPGQRGSVLSTARRPAPREPARPLAGPVAQCFGTTLGPLGGVVHTSLGRLPFGQRAHYSSGGLQRPRGFKSAGPVPAAAAGDVNSRQRDCTGRAVLSPLCSRRVSPAFAGSVVAPSGGTEAPSAACWWAPLESVDGWPLATLILRGLPGTSLAV